MGTVPEQQRSSYLMAIWAVVAALIVSYLVVFGLSAAARLPLPAELMYGESIVLDLSRRVARGEDLYPAPDRVPLVSYFAHARRVKFREEPGLVA
jgi:hypothetical protein